MKLSEVKIYGRSISDFLLPDQIEIAQRQLDESPAPDGWVSEKPVLDKEYILLTADWYQGRWNYNQFTVKQIDGFSENGSSAFYWGLVCSDGEEWGDIGDFKADMYKVIPVLPPKQ